MAETAKLQGPREASGVSVGGEEYPAIDGVVEVPVEYVAELASHGFSAWV